MLRFLFRLNDSITGKNNGFPYLDILGYLKNTHKNPKFGKVSQPGNSQPECLTLPNLGFLWVFFKYPKISKNGNLLFFPVNINQISSFCKVFFRNAFIWMNTCSPWGCFVPQLVWLFPAMFCNTGPSYLTLFSRGKWSTDANSNESIELKVLH